MYRKNWKTYAYDIRIVKAIFHCCWPCFFTHYLVHQLDFLAFYAISQCYITKSRNLYFVKGRKLFKTFCWNEILHANHSCSCVNIELLKFIYSEKATNFFEIFALLLSYVVPVKSKVKISQNFVAFSEYMNFTTNYTHWIQNFH